MLHPQQQMVLGFVLVERLICVSVVKLRATPRLRQEARTSQNKRMNRFQQRIGLSVERQGQRRWQKPRESKYHPKSGAGVAELANAVALGATGRKSLEVRVLSPAPNYPRATARLDLARCPIQSHPYSSPIESMRRGPCACFHLCSRMMAGLPFCGFIRESYKCPSETFARF